jgi:predicted RNA-binding Zn ribbon-like protein
LLFAPDTEETLNFTAALANTDPVASKTGADDIATVETLGAFLKENRFSGRIDHDEAELREVLETRTLVRTTWTLDRDDMVDEVNAMLREAHALTQLARHDGTDWHLHATAPDAPLAERIRVEVSLALADVIRSGATDRLRTCEADDCEGLLVDLSRNGSRRFCSVRCGNRMNMIAYRERQGA